VTFKRRRLKSDLPKQATFAAQPVGKGARDGAGASAQESSGAVNGSGALPQAEGAAEAARRQTERTTTTKRRLQRRVTPLDILQQPLLLARRKVFDLRRFLIVIALTTIVLLLPTPEGLSEQGHRALALFVFTGAILALEPAPLPISALLVPVAMVALGIGTVTNAFAPFGSPSVFLILTSLFLAEALRKHGLTRRLALHAIVLSGGRLPMLLLSIMLLTAVLGMWVMNTATTAVLIPVALTIAQRMPTADDGRRALPLLVMAVAYGASIGGLATIVGAGENAIAAGVINQVQPFGFIEWMKYGLPVALLLLPLSWWLLRIANPAPDVRLDTTTVEAEIARSGPLSGAEREILVVMALAVFLWVTGEQVERMLGLPPTMLSSVVVAIGAVAYLSFEEIVDWNDMKGVNWGVFLVIGAGFALGSALDATGANAWIAQLAQPVLQPLPFAVTLLAVIVIGFALTQVINDVTLGAIFSPILVALAQAIGIPPARLVVPTIIAVGLAYMLPSASARMALVAVTGAVERKQMLRTGLVVGLPSVIVVYLFFLLMTWVGWI
jgi:sodium-dependent dicarboxylate transporter 2/3/5